MLGQAQKIVEQYNELSSQISNPDIINNHNKLAKLAKAKGEKGRMARWQLNMRRGKKKKK